ncbi:MAG: GNAT family acetyltransferase [Phycisphaerales bacterium JB038]
MQKPGLQARPFDDADEAAVIALWRACDLVVPWNDPKADIERKRQVQRDLFLVGTLEGKIVACVMAGYEGHRGWINYLAVDPAHRRRGLGRLLMERAEDLLRQRGCPKINLQVREHNADVIAFYESLGYRNDHVVSLGKRLIADE